MCVCVCVCVRVCVWCVCVCACVHACVRASPYNHAYMCAHICTCTFQCNASIHSIYSTALFNTHDQLSETYPYCGHTCDQIEEWMSYLAYAVKSITSESCMQRTSNNTKNVSINIEMTSVSSLHTVQSILKHLK